MNIEECRKYCLSVKGTTESLTLLNHNVLTLKVMNKVFVYIPLEPEDGIFKIYLKCNLEKDEAPVHSILKK